MISNDHANEPATTGRPEVYTYEDYSRYVEDWKAWRRKSGQPYQDRWFAGELNQLLPEPIRSRPAVTITRSHLSNMFNQNRNITEPHIRLVARVLGLDHPEEEYFYALVMYNQDETKVGSQHWYGEMLKRRPVPACPDDIPLEDLQRFYSGWLYAAIYELACYADFEANPTWILERLRFKVHEDDDEARRRVHEALTTLIQVRFLQHQDGRWRQAEAVISTRGAGPALARSKTAYEQCFDLAKRALALPAEQRQFNYWIHALPTAQWMEIKEEVRGLIARIQGICQGHARAVRDRRDLGQSEQVQAVMLVAGLFPLAEPSQQRSEIDHHETPAPGRSRA